MGSVIGSLSFATAVQLLDVAYFLVGTCIIDSQFFIHSGCFYSVSSSPLLIRGAPDTARIILCQSLTVKRHRQLQVEDFPKVPTWRLGFEPATIRPKGAES